MTGVQRVLFRSAFDHVSGECKKGVPELSNRAIAVHRRHELGIVARKVLLHGCWCFRFELAAVTCGCVLGVGWDLLTMCILTLFPFPALCQVVIIV